MKLVEASAFSVPPPGSSAPAPKGVLEPAIIQQRVRANFRDCQRCYEDGLRRNPTLAGRVVLRFVIDRDGTISFLEASKETTMPDAEVTRCILAAFRFVVFPRPEGGIVTVVYPLAFSPGN